MEEINQQQPWNLLQKPIRVEMLTSPFSQPIFYDENYGIIQHFVGLNAEIIHILSTMMNFSSKRLVLAIISNFINNFLLQSCLSKPGIDLRI